MVIQHNLSAMNSHRQLGINNSSTSKNLEKLSSGFKVNRAGDDAAGLAISEKMRGQIRGLTMANQNAQNGVSLIQTAEGGLNETHSILQRMRELAVQSANGTYMDDVDRENIAKEVEALKSEIDRIASSTHYNGIKLLDGSLGGESVKALKAAGTTGATLGVLFENLGLGSSANNTVAAGNSLTLAGEYKTQYEGQEVTLVIRDDVQGGAAASITLQIGDKTYSMATAADVANSAGVSGITAGQSFITINDDGKYEVVAALGKAFEAASVTSSGVVKMMTAATGASAGQAFIYNDTTVVANNKSQLIFQIGANGTADQRVGLHVDNMSTGFLGDFTTGKFVHDIKVDTRENANDAIKVLDAAINQVSGTRADLGALQNRLEHTINNLGTTTENLQAAESTIRDVDMAKEMMEFTKNNILVQASQSMLAQANQLPQGVLQLLR